MLGQFKLLLVGGAIATLPFLPIGSSAVQDPERAPSRDSFHSESRWNFALLQYTPENGTKIEIPAKSISKLWLLTRPDGGMYLEILYDNTDYSLISIRDMHVIRRSPSFTSVDVPIVRTRLEGMGFPTFRQ